MFKLVNSFLLFLMLFSFVESRGGRGGFSRGGGSRSRGSSSSSGGSKSGSSGNSKPASSNMSPSGPPPAYPGLANRPVSNPNAPPAYSPSNSFPPAYSPGGQPGYLNNYNKHSLNPGYNSNPSYGSTFGSNGLRGNTYINNNYYGTSRSGGGSGFLMSALFFGAGMHHGYMWGGRNTYRDSRPWSSEDDQQWRATTKAPYFENKVPGSESYLPAAAILGAATAFGLASLLPLNVPQNKPLMYCNSTDIAQTQIKLDGNIYSCVNKSIAISCPRSYENSNIDECLKMNSYMKCDSSDSVDIYCTNGTLLSRSAIMCNSTTMMNGTNVNETIPILNCYPGVLPEKLASFIPTTTTEAPTTTAKPLSIEAKMHIFFLQMIGKGEILERKEKAPVMEDPRQALKENETAWIPEALTFPPETTTEYDLSTTATEDPFMYTLKDPRQHLNGTWVDGSMNNSITVPELMEDFRQLYKIKEDPGKE